MPTPHDQALYDRVRAHIEQIYKKPSAYRSGALVKQYKIEFAKKYGDHIEPYKDDGETKNLKRWFRERWINVNGVLGKTSKDAYPLYRPTVRISGATPLTLSEISPRNLLEQYEIKQRIRGDHNLPPFQKKRSTTS